MNLLQLLEATEDNQLKSWSSALDLTLAWTRSGVIPINIHFRGSRHLSDVIVNLANSKPRIYTVTGDYDIFKLIHARDVGDSNNLKKTQEYLQSLIPDLSLKKPNAKELMIQFAQNVFAQFIAAGGERGNYRYVLPLPKDDKIIRGVLKIYKDLDEMPDIILKILAALRRMGYKLPRDVLTAIQKSAKAQRSLDDV